MLSYPSLNEVEEGYTCFTLPVCLSVHLSVFGQSDVHSVLQYNMDPVHIYTPYQATSEDVSRAMCFCLFFQN